MKNFRLIERKEEKNIQKIQNEEKIKIEENDFNNDSENSNINNYSFLKFLKFDLKRKVKFENISFESEDYDINDPYYTSEEERKLEEKENSTFTKKEKNNLNMNISLEEKNVTKIKVGKFSASQIKNYPNFYDTENKTEREILSEANRNINFKKYNNRKIDFNEILAELNKNKYFSDFSGSQKELNNDIKNVKFHENDNENEDLIFSNNCYPFPYKLFNYSSENLSYDNNNSLIPNVSEINYENNLFPKRVDFDYSEKNINLNDYSFSRINSLNHSNNISGFMKKASNKTIETINRNSKNGFFSKKSNLVLLILNF
jgi:hypothetical protein